ncbi:hypothetical protein SK128_021993, partial [Halocaridina rubra]
TNDGSDASELPVLRAEVEHQRNLVEELEVKLKATLSQVDLMTRKDQEKQQERRDLDRKLAFLQHDLKEAQRKADNEGESRRKLDSVYQEIKKKLEDEQNKRTRDLSSALQTNDKLNSLEKQIKEVQDKLKIESDANTRLRKLNAEQNVLIQQKESTLQDHMEKLAGNHALRDTLERELVNIQALLDKEKALKNHQIDLHSKSENKVHSLQAELEKAQARESVARKEADKFSDRLVQLEKDKTSLELELRSMTSRYEQEAKTLREANSAAPTNHQTSAQALA